MAASTSQTAYQNITECMVCYETYTGTDGLIPVRNNDKNCQHLMSLLCYKALKECPLCRTPLTDEPIFDRNAMELINFIREQNNQIITHKNEIAHLNKQIIELSTTIETDQEKMIEMQEEIKALSSRIIELQNMVVRLQDETAVRRNQIIELGGRIKEGERYADEQRQTIQNLSLRIEHLKTNEKLIDITSALDPVDKPLPDINEIVLQIDITPPQENQRRRRYCRTWARVETFVLSTFSSLFTDTYIARRMDEIEPSLA